jgi:hypothetical protein
MSAGAKRIEALVNKAHVGGLATASAASTGVTSTKRRKSLSARPQAAHLRVWYSPGVRGGPGGIFEIAAPYAIYGTALLAVDACAAATPRLCVRI